VVDDVRLFASSTPLPTSPGRHRGGPGGPQAHGSDVACASGRPSVCRGPAAASSPAARVARMRTKGAPTWCLQRRLKPTDLRQC